MGSIGLLRIGIKKAAQNILDRIIKALPIYYTSINSLPLSRWFELKDNKFEALYKVNWFKHVPLFFYEISVNMLFEFEQLDCSLLRKRADMVVLNSIAARTNNKAVKFQADILKKEIENSQNKESKDITLNQFINYIEETFNSIGTINPDKMSTSRAFSLYNRAIEKNKSNVNNRK